MTNDLNDLTGDVPDRQLDALLRRADVSAPSRQSSDLEARILAQAEFALAGRRRAARGATRGGTRVIGTADTLAAWVRIALPLAAAAALFAAVSLTRIESGTVAEAELRESDPAALLSALESDGSSGLAHHVIASDAVSGGSTTDQEPQ